MVRERGGDPDRIRTCDHRLRRPVLYPAELRDRKPARPGRLQQDGRQCVQGILRSKRKLSE